MLMETFAFAEFPGTERNRVNRDRLSDSQEFPELTTNLLGLLQK